MEEDNLPQTLPHRLVEVMLVVGFDEDTGLPTLPSKEPEIDKSVDNIFKNDYEPCVLAAVSSSTMVYFYPFIRKDETYPPSSTHTPTRAMHSSYSSTQIMSLPESSVSCKFHRFGKSFHPTHLRSVSVNPKIISRQVSARGQVGVAPELPISDEVIRSIAAFCFPDGAKVYSEKPENSVHFLVLTDMSGFKTYTSCLTFYRSFIVDKDEQRNLYLSLEISPATLKSGQARCYIPNCAVLISKYPYYTVLKECLSSLTALIEKDQEEMYTFIKDYAHILTWTPVPPAGDVAIDLNLCQLSLTLNPPDHPEKPVIDFPMHLTFLCFPIEEVLKIITCILVEERLLFLTTNYALLTVVMESFRNFILPFSWRFTYVPVLSSKSLGFLQAPGTFMFGCHSRHKEEAEQVEGLVVVDIDNGMIKINPDENGKVKDIPMMPWEPANVFKSKCKQIVLQFTLMDLNRPFIYNMEELRQHYSMKIGDCNSAIASSCLELMVNLFRDVIFDTRVEHRRFNRTSFLDRKKESEREFYERVSKSDMFKAFVKDRLNGKSDYWSDLEMRTRKEAGVEQNPKANPIPGGRRLIRKPSSLTLFSPTVLPRKDFTKFRLPDVVNACQYVKNSILTLNKAIKECPDFGQRATYQYLRGLFHVANGDNIAAMDDLINLSAATACLHHTHLLHDIYQKLTDNERQQISERRYYHQLSDIMKKLDLHETPQGKSHLGMEPTSIPDKELSFDEFAEMVSLLEMSNDYDTIYRLYEALTFFKRSSLDPTTFINCHTIWEDNQNKSHCIKVESGNLEENETILKVSEVIKTDFGIGRIGLTDKRLFFLKDVSNNYREIARLRDINKIEKTQATSFLSAVDVLQITTYKKKSENNVFTAWLKEERNWWYMLIYEMWAGKVVSMETKDLVAISHAAQNVLLIDAIIWSDQMECTAYHEDVERAASHLAYYTQYMDNGHHKLPRDTLEALQHRLDPNMAERERKTVQALLYTPGEGSVQPRLWCGLSDGKVKVYNGNNWILESENVQTRNCVLCLTAVGKKHVWAGSHGIFIIDTDTITSNRTLMDHPDQVVGIVLTEDGKKAFTASVDGTILKWDVQTLTVEQPHICLSNILNLLSLKIYNDQLWLGTRKSVIVADMMGNTLQTFEYKEKNRLLEFDYFIKPTDKEHAAPTFVKQAHISGKQDITVTFPTASSSTVRKLWVGCRREGRLLIWDLEAGELTATILVPNTNGICYMIKVGKELWIGTKAGTICVYNIETKQLCKELQAHKDTVRVICSAQDRYIISGAGSKDGRIALWSASANTTDSGSYPDPDQ